MNLTAACAVESSSTLRGELTSGDKGKDNVNKLSFFMSFVLRKEQRALKLQLQNNQVQEGALDKCLLHAFQMLLREFENRYKSKTITHLIHLLKLHLRFGAKWDGTTLATPYINQVTPYHIICKCIDDQHEILELMIKADVGKLLDAKDSARVTPLLFAVTRANLNCVKILIRNGADINLPRDNSRSPGLTPLIEAVRVMYPTYDAQFAVRKEIFDFLLESGADVNKPDCKKCTPLMHAASMGSVECIEKLLRIGAQLNVTDQKGRYIWEFAIELANVDIHKCPFHHGARSAFNDTVLKCLSDHSVDVLKCLFDHGVAKDAADAHGRSILYFAVSSGKVSLVRYILNQGINMIPDIPTPFHQYCKSDSNKDPCIKAIQLKRLDLVQMLDWYNCQMLRTLFALRSAVVLACESVIKYLLSKHNYPLNEIYAFNSSFGVKVSTTVLADACTHCSLKVITMLLNRGADPNIKNDTETCCTPLHRAITKRHGTMVAKLIRSGADMNARSFDDNVNLLLLPYEASVMYSNINAVAVLFISGCVRKVYHGKSDGMPYKQRIVNQIKSWNLHDDSVSSLCQMCRTVILKQLSPATSKKINELPLPLAIMKYLGIPELDKYLGPS